MALARAALLLGTRRLGRPSPWAFRACDCHCRQVRPCRKGPSVLCRAAALALYQQYLGHQNVQPRVMMVCGSQGLWKPVVETGEDAELEEGQAQASLSWAAPRRPLTRIAAALLFIVIRSMLHQQSQNGPRAFKAHCQPERDTVHELIDEFRMHRFLHNTCQSCRSLQPSLGHLSDHIGKALVATSTTFYNTS